MLLTEMKKSFNQALVNKVLYIERIASILDVDSTKFDSDKFPNLLEMTEADINKIVADYPKESVNSNGISDVELEIVKSLEKDIISGSSRKLEDHKYNIRNALENAAQHQREVERYLVKAAEARENKLAFEKMLETMTVPTIVDLANNPFFKIRSSLSNSVCLLETETVVMTKVVEGNNYSVNFGKFIVNINLTTRVVYVLRDKENILVDGYYHPYISSSGKICWGDSVEVANKFLLEYKFKEYLEHLKSLLCDFSTTSTPYMGLMSFWKAQQIKLGLEEPEPELCETCDEEIDNCACYTCQGCDERVIEQNMCTEDECMRCNDCGHHENCPNDY